MERFVFTIAKIRDLAAPPAGRFWVYDAKQPALCLAVTHKGLKTFYVYKRIGAKPTRISVGRFPEIDVDAARERAAKMLVKIYEGADPADERRQLRRSQTLGELWQHYCDHWTAVRGRASTIKTEKNRWKACLEDWKDRRLNTIKPSDVAAKHAELGRHHGHVQANRAVQLLRRLFNYAVDNVGIDLANPVKVTFFREVQRERFLQPDELPRFFAALDDEPDDMQSFFLLCLFTGARKGNVESMAWQDVDLAGEKWTIPAASFKTGRPMTVPLAPEALAILNRRRQAAFSPFVFPGAGKTGHIVEEKRAWKEILARSGIRGLTIHDLRRTLGSWQAGLGASLPIIGRSLGHKRPETTAIYARLNLDPVRTSVNAATAAIVEAAKKKRQDP
jgi:integrase